jgi:phospholipid/cholesterol/gamma-HCH transport system substrate-binding protein
MSAIDHHDLQGDGAGGGARDAHEGGLGVREQIERYRSAFIAVVTMIVIAALVGGYILSHENLKLPTWVPVLGHNYFTLKAEFQNAEALTPGQGQAVTIAGAKIGEIASVDLHNGVALVTMHLTPKYALIYHDATLLMRPKTELEDMTVEVNPGSPATGRVPSGATIPLAQTAPNAHLDELWAGLDADTRAYLQLLLAGAGEGFKENGPAFAAVLKRFDPLAREAQEITRELHFRHEDIAHSIHNFRLLMEAFGNKDKQLADVIDASNAVFAAFAQEQHNVERTLQLLPGALSKTEHGLGKITTAFNLVGPTLGELQPFARSVAPAEEAARASFKTTTPIIQNDIRPFARQILPTINALGPDTKQLAEAFPHLSTTFSVFNEFFNEIAYNPGKNQPGFLFFLDWGAHNLNSAISSADAHGPLGRTLLYINCEVLPLFKGVAKINKTVNILVGLTNPPTAQECASEGILKGGTTTAATTATAASAHAKAGTSIGGRFSGLITGAYGDGAGAVSAASGVGVGATGAKPSAAHPSAGEAGSSAGSLPLLTGGASAGGGG